MPRTRIVDVELQEQKRALRAEIARGRRRIDGRLRSLGREGARLTSWRTYVARYPAAALGLAVGCGFFLSKGLPGRGLGRWILGQAMHQALAGFASRSWDEAWSVLQAVMQAPAEQQAGRTPSGKKAD